jgi:DNA-binding transcriptional LysR family regulator
MELNHLKYFYQVAQEGSFTGAAKVLRVQQPTISKMVRSVEAQLGLTLVERRKRGILLTAAGSRVFEACKDIFGRIEEIEAISDQEDAECRGPLNFGVNDCVSSHLVPPVLRGYLKDHPKVRPSIFSGNSALICREILEGRIDFGMFFATPDPRGFDIIELSPVTFHLVTAARVAGALSPGDVCKSLIVSREIDYERERRSPSLEMLRKSKIGFEALITSNTYDSQKKLVSEGLGAALIPAFMVKNEIRSGMFQRLYPKKTFQYSLKLIQRKGKVLPKSASVFLKYFQAALPELVQA